MKIEIVYKFEENCILFHVLHIDITCVNHRGVCLKHKTELSYDLVKLQLQDYFSDHGQFNNTQIISCLNIMFYSRTYLCSKVLFMKAY